MMAEVITTTRPNSEGEMLWCVHFKSSYYDSDPRMPGTVPVDDRFYVLAKGREEALSKAKRGIANARSRADANAKAEIEVTVVTIEDLVPARDSSNDGRLGWISTSNLSQVKLSNAEDAKRYRLAVCLVPIE